MVVETCGSAGFQQELGPVDAARHAPRTDELRKVGNLRLFRDAETEREDSAVQSGVGRAGGVHGHPVAEKLFPERFPHPRRPAAV